MKNPESPADNLLTAEDDALSLSCDVWRRVMEGLGEPRFRADQICQWIYGHKVFDYVWTGGVSRAWRRNSA